MANHKSSEKRARQTIRRTKRNDATENSVRTAEKRVLAALSSNDATSAKTFLAQFSSTIQKASNKGVIHYRSAARRISRLSTRLQKLATGAATK